MLTLGLRIDLKRLITASAASLTGVLFNVDKLIVQLYTVLLEENYPPDLEWMDSPCGK